MSFWDQRYGGDDYAYGTEPNGFLVSQVAHLPPGGRVLCLAEGEGRNAVYLAQQGFRVLGVDQSAVGLEKARSLAARRGVGIETQVADLGMYVPVPGSWQGVVSIFAHMPGAVRRVLHARVVAGLAPGGVLILEAYTSRQPDMGGRGGPTRDQPDLFMSLAGLVEELAGLEILHGRETERPVDEGAYHGGMGAVVQVVARKP